MPSRSAAQPSHDVVDELLVVRTSKWTASVILHLRTDTRRFTELQREINGISQKALTATLRTLERDGFVSRTSYPTIPPRVDYALTDLGHEVLKLMRAYEDFAQRHWHRVKAARDEFDARESQTEIELLRVRAS